TWTDITGNLPSFPVASVAVVNGLVFVGTDVGVYAASSISGSGTIWSRTGSGFPDARVTGFAFDAKNNILAASTYGGGAGEIIGAGGGGGGGGGGGPPVPGPPPAAPEGQPTGKVTIASFPDSAGSEPISNYTATVNWGDGTSDTLTSSNGAIVTGFSS